MFSSVLVLCVGNVCRSPMAVAMMRQRLGSTTVCVDSAGIAALSGSPIDPSARAVLDAHCVPLQPHAARQVNHELLHQAELILVMERRHMPDLLRFAPAVRGRTFSIGQWQGPLDPDIADPYRRPLSAFEQTYAQLSRCIDDWLPHFQSEETR
ncbi:MULTISPECIES: low molecular weight protein-tyrosine-phosphatase [Pseudomonas syringae group]|uniref:low molecular weight protein-tyrosine-phosphatase n=1 Tax=Pseudomonas syringae group TaxID=136849 RepID=UPI000F00D31A|nr:MULTISPECIES: low molecular weight protein-tyrosine-phosphatase [Pseudomonas syringae group]MCF5716011.1 low molecular weight phosphotyrosine protein phosphatase [Pseudomonas tremae]MCF5744661.1 low molecular weight phosphotyrosine protein phosphatase [Pseudomonas tremae]RMN24479.1 Low molecular weight phosphotyrosine protein phosphatase [Pseudomonas coronafaciens pv. zizaniae]RMS11083.1 Low molecular weight phosphotyrosine protein phosphatase [Pseudomonas coronafaciens pv. coronafaciens]UQ